MLHRLPILLALAVFLMAPAASAQPVPDNDAVPDLTDAPRQQVISAITGHLQGPNASEATRSASVFGSLWPLLGDAVDEVLFAALQGPGNTAIISQSGANNRAEVVQRGRSNAAVMLQFGSGNTSTLLQEGDHNAYGSLLSGSNNTLDVEQIGNENTYLFGFQGNNLNHTVQQIGNNINAVQIGVGHAPFGIEQRGNNMDITIRHNGAQ